MTPESALNATWIWMAIYAVGASAFFVIAIWGIYRGGLDVLELLKNEKNGN